MAQHKPRIKKGDQVQVMAGRDKGARGKVLRVHPETGKAVIERINLVKKHTRPNPQKQVQGGILEREAPIDLSNLMVVDPQSGKPTRVARKRLDDGRMVRIAKASGVELD